MKSSEIRKHYLGYFEKHGHTVRPSDGLIPSGDPTLLFTSAGMVQFKKHFLGQSKDTFTRAATCQKCFRTSDIDQVGQTNRHLTFFEMLGNFSFGDYFKKDAIAWGWEFLTKEMGLDKDKLYITIYKDDPEAGEIWKNIIPSSHIIPMGDDTNFWNMGPTGPCGPCSELLYDLGQEMSCGKPDCGPQCSCNRYLEVWNLVFTQFDRQADGSLKPLPRKNIDTGMGLERLVAVANGKKNVFETDLFMPIIEEISGLLDVPVTPQNIGKFRMMADHARALTLVIGDGILPSNEGRGYVLRRILRRALRQGKLFGAKGPYLYHVTAKVAEIMKSAYPELTERRESIASIAKMEEEKFLDTLEGGTKILEELISRHQGTIKPGETAAHATKFILPGNEVFKLYDTYGFPPDLTREICREHGLDIDQAGFEQAQKVAQEKSRAAWSGSGEKDITFYSQLHKEMGDTSFTGYTRMKEDVTVKAIIVKGRKADKLSAGEEGELILSASPFYAESGGQVGDTGTLVSATAKAEVSDVQKPVGGLFVHTVKILTGEITAGSKLSAVVNEERRRSIMRHHTATHLLHKALRQVVGTHVTQAGSQVTPDNFRFDFTHLKAVTADELRSAEAIVNEAIRANYLVTINEMNIDEARKKGAMALFGEKYGDTVRAVCVAETVDTQPFSMELCGGTHVGRTGDIGSFKIVSESSVAAGTRRIEAVAGKAADDFVSAAFDTLNDAAAKLKANRQELPERIDRTLALQKDLEREVNKLKLQLASSGTDDLIKNAKNVNGVKLLTGKLADVDTKSLRELGNNLKTKLGSGVIVMTSVVEGKVSFIVTVTADLLASGYSSGKIAKEFAALIAGSGGGKPDFAQGGGNDPSKIDAAFDAIATKLK